MSNIIKLSVPHRRQSLTERSGDLAAVFAGQRWGQEDVFWLKENAEFLNITECTGTPLTQEALENWSEFYDGLEKRLNFFPQYYRFLLSIPLDLEDLGMPGQVGERACAWVAGQGLPEAEFSDLQRAEARRLLARRGVETGAVDPGLDDRLRAFVGRNATFALPNKKAAYELTHIVFYLSEYGRRAPDLPETALISLEYAGVLAVLEQNMDLLAEVCVALRYAGQTPNPRWEEQVVSGLKDFGLQESGDGSLADDYHEYLVSGWAAATAGDAGLSRPVPCGRVTFSRQPSVAQPLRLLSSALYQLDQARSGDWIGMRDWAYGCMDDDAQMVLNLAESTSPNFERFFEGFARAQAG